MSAVMSRHLFGFKSSVLGLLLGLAIVSTLGDGPKTKKGARAILDTNSGKPKPKNVS